MRNSSGQQPAQHHLASNPNTESSAFSSVKTPRARHDTGTGSFSIRAAAGVTHIMSRPVLAKIKLMISAGAAKPAPPVGPALGQHGLNIMEFCKAFNAKTADFIPDTPIPVVITAYKDKSFEVDNEGLDEEGLALKVAQRRRAAR